MKLQGDWAFCTGINRITFHRFQHQPYLDRVPGFTMGWGVGVHWERTQTWWNLVGDYHRYLARCQYLLQQGTAVSDILYLLPEGAPQVFTPPESALTGSGVIKDQRGYRFDGCDPMTLMELAIVKNGRVTFDTPNATEYRLLVLPQVKTMTPKLLSKIEELARNGATIIGLPPEKSPSLQNYPQTDVEVRALADKIWQQNKNAAEMQINSYHKGRVIMLPELDKLKLKISIKLSDANWIWFPESEPQYNNPANNAPGETRFFRKTFSLSDNVKVDEAVFLATADNELTVQINGQTVHQTSLSKPINPISFEKFLKSGSNTIELKATNFKSEHKNPAGVIGSFAIRFIDQNGKTNLTKIITDATWESSQNENKTNIQPAKILGKYGVAPWGSVKYSGSGSDALYPDYQVLEKIFELDGVVADVVSDKDSLRFFHRRDGETDIYFLSNKTMRPFDGKVAFRVNGKNAYILNPKTGQKYQTKPTTQNSQTGQTTIPLFLEGAESVFVIFDRNEVAKDLPVWQQIISSETVLDLGKDWAVLFEPSRGAPSKATFDELQDWSKNNDEGIKYFSGIATYEKKFTLSQVGKGNKRLFLDLGNVEVMARVHINGKEVGTCWVNPYRFEVTDYVKDGENVLQIEVANLWANRLIGDSKLPKEKRITWTTWNNVYNPNSPLLPSGLIGPVKIFASEK
jgi:hypothetical protein